MKKLLFSLGLVFGIQYASQAQCSLSVDIGKDICINDVTIYCDDGYSTTLSLGCEGIYRFDTGTHFVSEISIGNTACLPGTTYVELGDGKKKVTVTSTIQDESRSFNSIIR